MKTLSFFLILLAAACSTSKTKLTEGGKKVKVIGRPGKQCDIVRKIVGENDEGSPGLAKNHARNLAAKDGADAIVFNQVVSNGKEYTVHATAYDCHYYDEE